MDMLSKSNASFTEVHAKVQTAKEMQFLTRNKYQMVPQATWEVGVMDLFWQRYWSSRLIVRQQEATRAKTHAWISQEGSKR